MFLVRFPAFWTTALDDGSLMKSPMIKPEGKSKYVSGRGTALDDGSLMKSPMIKPEGKSKYVSGRGCERSWLGDSELFNF